MAIEYMLTTVDNLYDPFDDFDRWFAEDRRLAMLNGRRDCCSYFAEVLNLSPRNDDEYSVANGNEAIDWILRYDPTRTEDGAKVYTKVGREMVVKTAHRPDWDALPEYEE